MSIGIRWLSSPPGNGFGNATMAYLGGLRAAHVPVSWSPLIWPSDAWASEFGPTTSPLSVPSVLGCIHSDIVNRQIPHDSMVICSSPFWHDRLLLEAQGRRLIAFTAWETSQLPDSSVALLNRYERIVVPSRFNVEVLRRSGVTVPVHAVPHCIDPSTLAVANRNSASARFTFYLIATWTSRKAILDTVEAFIRAFNNTDPVTLVIHTTGDDLIAQHRLERNERSFSAAAGSTWVSLAQKLGGRDRVPHIVLSTRHLDAHQMTQLHLRGDCCISLSRGEGWGLGTFEAGALGRPVVVTGWGGHLEYLPDGYPYCADYDLVPTLSDPPDKWWFPRPDESWAKVNINHAAQVLRQVFDDRVTASEWGRYLQDHILSTFDVTQVTSQLLHALCSDDE